MTQQSFERRHEAQWKRLELLLDAARARRGRQDALTYQALYGDCDDADFDHLYRMACLHLALARQRLYGADLVERLNSLALRAHQRFYGPSTGNLRGALRFLVREFPALVRERWGAVLLSALLFVGPGVGLGLATYRHPELAYSVMDAQQVRQIEEMYDPANDFRTRERRSDGDVFMFGFYVMNNVSVAFRTFAGGIALGAGSVLFLVFNGLFLGAAGGYVVAAGHGTNFFSFVAGHSALELTGIVLAGAAGLNLGGAVIAPGRHTRVEALKTAARGSVRIMGGVGAMLVGAAFIEAFWSSTVEIGAELKYVAGLASWAATLGFLGLAGRPRGS